MNLSPKRWFSVTRESLPPELLVRACRLVLVDYCCFDVALPAACADAGLTCASGGGLPDWAPAEPPLPPRVRREPHDCCDLRKKKPRPRDEHVVAPPRLSPPPLDPAVAGYVASEDL